MYLADVAAVSSPQHLEKLSRPRFGHGSFAKAARGRTRVVRSTAMDVIGQPVTCIS